MSDEAKKYGKEVIAQDGAKQLFNEENFAQTIERLNSREEQLLPECEVKNSLEFMNFQDCKVYSLTKEGYENVVLYLHGGAWHFGISPDHISFCDKLVTKLNAKVYMPLYPLAPQADSQKTYAFIESLYKELLKENKTIYIMGDSAGGHLTLGLMYAIKAENLKKPAKMVLIAPCADITMSNKEMEELNKTDPMLELYGCRKCAVLWAGEDNLRQPKNSALFADVTGYPDTMLFQGTNDILYPDNMLFYQKMKDAGVNITLVIGKGFWHVFPTDPIPEQQEALDLIEKFCAEK